MNEVHTQNVVYTHYAVVILIKQENPVTCYNGDYASEISLLQKDKYCMVPLT